MMKRENLVLDTLCFRIFILKLRKWVLQGSVGERPVYERDFPILSIAEASTKLENLRVVLNALEIEVENLQTKFNNNMVPVGAEDAFIREAELLDVADLYGFASPLETLLALQLPQLVPEDRLTQVIHGFGPSRVFVKATEHDPVPNSSGWFMLVNGVEFYTDSHLPEDKQFIPAGYAIVGS